MRDFRLMTGTVVFSLGLLLGVTALADWPQWRGPTRDGLVVSAAWPTTLDERVLKPLWRVEMAEGYPGPIISGDRVFTVETLEEKDEVVRCFDVKTGQQQWEKRWPGAMKVPFFARRNGSWIKATPACDGERLYVMGMLDDLVCLDVKTGDEVWRVDFKQRYATNAPMFGQACSPLVDGDAVYVQAGLSVCKLNKKTGETIWRAMDDAREMNGGNFSSPVIATVAGKRQLLVQTRAELAGIDIESGAVLWRQTIKSFRGMNILPPTAVGQDTVFTSSYGGGSYMFRLTANADGTLASEQLWANDIEGYMSSPLVIDGYLYMHKRDQTFTCIDPKTGQAKWTSERKFGEYWSTVYNGKHILALDQNGTLLLIEASPDEACKIIAERKIAEEETWAHLALEGDRLYVRELKGLAVYRWAVPQGLD